MKKYVREINADVVSAMERLAYEYETKKDNITFLIDRHSDDPDFLTSEIFKRYQDDEIKSKADYEKAKKEFEGVFVPKELREHKITWELSFQTRQLTITQLCDCEVELCAEDQKILQTA
jgi:hypothetical protein